MGQVPQLTQLVVGERQAGQAARQVLAAFAEMRRDVRFKMTKKEARVLKFRAQCNQQS